VLWRVGENSRFGQVQIAVAEASTTGSTISIGMTDAILGSNVVPIVLRAMHDAFDMLDAADVLASRGPVVSATELFASQV
jgi:hypothetical protein